MPIKRDCKNCPMVKECKQKCAAYRKSIKKMPTKIGQAVYEVRLDLDLTQRELAEKLGLAQAAVASWERGIGNRKPLAKQALELSRLSGYPVERFIDDGENKEIKGD